MPETGRKALPGVGTREVTMRSPAAETDLNPRPQGAGNGRRARETAAGRGQQPQGAGNGGRGRETG